MPEDVSILLKNLISTLRIIATKRRLLLSLKIEGALPDALSVDAVTLRQVLLNLVGNAINFTDKGGVVLEASWNAGNLRLCVRNIRSGIPRDALDRVIEPTQQGVDPHVTGAGLVLAITRKLVELMRGTIQAGPAPCGGTNFEVCIPAALATPATPQPKPVPQPALTPLSGRVLVAEDDESLRDLIELFLHELGLECRLVGDGSHAVDAALAGRFDVLLMDLEMPVMDGFEAIRVLRERGYQAPIIALTAHREGLEIDRARREGCNGVLNKPVTIGKLLETIAPLLGGQGSSRSTATQGQVERVLAMSDEEIPVKIDRTLAVLVPKFLADCRRMPGELRGAIESGDIAVTRRIGHSLIGTGSSYGFEGIGSLGEEIQRAARAGDTEALRNLAERLDNYLARVRPVFD